MKATVWNVLAVTTLAAAIGFGAAYTPQQTAKAPEVHTCIVPAGYYGEIREIKGGPYITYTCNIFKDKTNELVKVYHYGVPLDQHRGAVVQVQQQ